MIELFQFQVYVILNGIKTDEAKNKQQDKFQVYVILNGIKTKSSGRLTS